jgi:hypothetical protein
MLPHLLESRVYVESIENTGRYSSRAGLAAAGTITMLLPTLPLPACLFLFVNMFITVSARSWSRQVNNAGILKLSMGARKRVGIG